MSKTDAWMPLYIGDYLSDTAHLSCEQSGAYLHLMMHYWRRGSLPDDNAALALIARLPVKRWIAHRTTLEPFFSLADGRWFHKRIDAERSRAEATSKRFHERAKKAAEARHGGCYKQSKSNATSNGQAMLLDCQSHSQSQGSLEPNGEPSGSLSAEPTLTPKMVVEAWNERMVPQGFPAVKRVTGTREKYLKARIRENNLADFETAMSALERSSFCRGENKDGWRADFDFFVQARSFTKLMEGSFDH